MSDVPPDLASIRERLIAMANEDQAVRAELVRTGELFDGYAPRMAEVHSRNARQLKAIMDAVGWPGPSKVGEEAARAAWLVLQHSIGNPNVMRQGLALLQEAPRGEVSPVELAMLEDRIRVNSGRKQRFGTQFDWDSDGQLSPLAIEDPDNVDDRRHALGMVSLAEKTRELREAAEREGERAPKDFSIRQKELTDWRRSVGWL